MYTVTRLRVTNTIKNTRDYYKLFYLNFGANNFEKKTIFH